ncbi:HAD family hydrolase [Wenjunlia tyrosinilytica]|uniref:Hydrolase n=1 Tax=Wenjunlia tyrosinilytica TaxID=1544741 RepID=A0A917ZTS0_9ACTN|nr:HAD family phosphatase [Wenjunlia tyrosinilytica]GGO90282.1 hydrolase [Wenjunlia tyrosinilytica]
MTAHRILSWTPAAIVFDCDGTLMDTERHWQDARDLVLREYGFAPAPGFAERAKGLHYTECGRLMADEAGRPDLTAEMTGLLLEHFRDRVADNPVTMPGARELVLAGAKFAPLAVASNCPKEVVEDCLERAALLDSFAHIAVPDSETRPKPHPDVYLTAARHCGADPADTLAVEDSYCGIQSAARAGMRVMGVGPRPAERELGLVDLWVRTLDQPDVRRWAGDRVPRQTPRCADPDEVTGDLTHPAKG